MVLGAQHGHQSMVSLQDFLGPGTSLSGCFSNNHPVKVPKRSRREGSINAWGTQGGKEPSCQPFSSLDILRIHCRSRGSSAPNLCLSIVSLQDTPILFSSRSPETHGKPEAVSCLSSWKKNSTLGAVTEVQLRFPKINIHSKGDF